MYLGSNAVLSGFTLTNGTGYTLGGGVFSEPSSVVTNCVLTGCTTFARGGGGAGGGAYGGNLYNCTLTGNWAGGGGGAYGSTLYNCTLTDNHVWLGGGGGASGSTLNNCTLTGNSAWDGGGASGCTLYNCTLTGNSAGDSGNCFGGGAYDSTLYNCTLTGNITYGDGGGAGGSTLYNCTLTGNSANWGGGGASGCILYNCTVTGNDGGGVGDNWWGVGSTLFNSIVYYNFGGNYAAGTRLNYCCTIPLPTNGVGNISSPPLFMDWDAEDFRLREESPCIDAGTNLMGFPIMVWRYVEDWGDDWVLVGHITDPTDMLGNTRFIDGNFDGTVAWDMGAYEFNSFPPPRFTCAPQRMPDCWRLSIIGAPNKFVRLQKSSDLKDWEDCWPYVFMGAEGACQWDDGDLSQKAMFYRVVVE